MPLARLRSMFLPALLASVLMLAAAFYLEWGMALEPCPLCYSQRLFLGGFALVCLCAVVHAPGRLGRVFMRRWRCSLPRVERCLQPGMCGCKAGRWRTWDASHR
ncbi:disulfide bond formation protein B [compost metagenome]